MSTPDPTSRDPDDTPRIVRPDHGQTDKEGGRMIRAGRSAVTRVEIAALHGLTSRQATDMRPWQAPGHPAPVRPAAGRTPALWDEQQATAFARGEPVPALPDGDDPADLFDAGEAAELAGIDAATWRRYGNRERPLIPPPDDEPGGVAHWRRDTLERWRTSRPGQGAGGGRPTRDGQRRTREETAHAAREAIGRAAERGRPLTSRELGDEIGVSHVTAAALLREQQAEHAGS